MKLRRIAIILLIFTLASLLVAICFRAYANFMATRNYETIEQIHDYAQTLPEDPVPDNSDWQDPIYDEFYKHRINFLRKFVIEALNLPEYTPWNPGFLVSILEKLAVMNSEKGFSGTSSNLILIKAKPNDRFFVFGDIHGAFHSMVRNIRHFAQEGLITNDLKLADNIYLMFNGDAIDRSAYDIDTLTLLALLLEKNPNQVFYLAGRHEREDYWSSFSLRRELVFRANHLSKQKVPFHDQISRFFGTLPLAVYVMGKHDNHDAVRISFFERESLPYDERTLVLPSLHENESLRYFTANSDGKFSSPLDVRAIVATEEWREFGRISNGLGLLDQSGGATAWAVLSSPILIHRAFIDFQDDAYAQIVIPDRIVNGSIKSIHQDSILRNGYQSGPPRNIVTSSQLADQPKWGDIKVASSLSLVRGVPARGKQLRVGLSLAANVHNANNNSKKNLLRLYVENDNYSPPLAQENTVNFLNQGIKFFLAPFGTPTLTACLDLIRQNNAFVFFPQSGSSSVRKKNLTQIIHFHASYEDEARALIRAVKNRYNARKYAIFYANDSYGWGPYLAMTEELKRQGITDILPLTYTRGSLSFEKQVAEIKSFSPDAIGIISNYRETIELIRQIGLGDLLSTKLFGISPIDTIHLERFTSKLGIKIMLSSPVPNPFDESLQIAKTFVQEMKASNNIIDAIAFEGYIAMRLLLEALNKLGKKDPQPHDVMKVFEAMKNVNFHGLPLGFDPETRSLAEAVWIKSDDHRPWQKFSIH